MNEINLDYITKLHIDVLKEILQEKSFLEIEKKFSIDFEKTNYKEIVIEKAKRLTFNNHGKLIGAYPVSPIPNDHKINVNGVGSGYAMCAIDALGAAFTFGATTEIASKTANSNTPIEITIDPKIDVNPPSDIVVTYLKMGYGSLQELVAENAQLAVDACPNINFYLNRSQVPDIEGIEILDLNTAIQEARKIFHPDSIKAHIRKSLQK